MMGRREFLGMAAAGIGLTALAGCTDDDGAAGSAGDLSGSTTEAEPGSAPRIPPSPASISRRPC